MNLAAVLFDATGTLIDPREPVGETYARIARRHGVELPAWRIDDAFRRILSRSPERVFPEARDCDEARDAERAWWRQVVRGTFLATDNTAQFADFDAFFADVFGHYGRGDAWSVAPGTPAMLAECRATGLTLGIVSNFDLRLRDIFQDLELAHFMDVIMLPALCGAAKPAAAIFDAALGALKVPASRAAYVGHDAEKDLEAARAAGLLAIDVATLPDLTALPAQLAAVATLPPRT